MSHVLITGGAGFIGSHLADLLISKGHEVRILDSLVPQVHSNNCVRPSYLDPEVELLVGDIRDATQVRTALHGIDAVVHLAAAVGVGQSMYEIAQYVAINDLGTAVLLQALLKQPVQRLVVASSMSVYGEGLAVRSDGSTVEPKERGLAQLKRGRVEPEDAHGHALVPLATPETKQASLSSIMPLTSLPRSACASSSAVPMTSRPRPCASSMSTAPARRLSNPTPACWQSSARGCSMAVRR